MSIEILYVNQHTVCRSAYMHWCISIDIQYVNWHTVCRSTYNAVYVNQHTVCRSTYYMPIEILYVDRQFPTEFDRRDSSSGRASASCAVGQDGCRIDTWPRHTKDVIKMVPVATLLGAQHYKASTGFSSLTNHASLTLHNEQKKKKNKAW